MSYIYYVMRTVSKNNLKESIPSRAHMPDFPRKKDDKSEESIHEKRMIIGNFIHQKAAKRHKDKIHHQIGLEHPLIELQSEQLTKAKRTLEIRFQHEKERYIPKSKTQQKLKGNHETVIVENQNGKIARNEDD